MMDPFERAPAHIRDLYKKYQKGAADMLRDTQILDLRNSFPDKIRVVGSISSETIISACLELEDDRISAQHDLLREAPVDKLIIEHADLPGGLPVDISEHSDTRKGSLSFRT
jgi:hypothetical protein